MWHYGKVEKYYYSSNKVLLNNTRKSFPGYCLPLWLSDTQRIFCGSGSGSEEEQLLTVMTTDIMCGPIVPVSFGSIDCVNGCTYICFFF